MCFQNGNELCIDSASCGILHTVIISKSNDLICFGKNDANQCSAKINSDKILYPHILSKDDELKFLEDDYIEKAIGLLDSTIIITNCIKRRWNRIWIKFVCLYIY